MSEEQFLQFFTDADADGSGELTVDELLALLQKKGYSGSESDIKAYFRQCDTSADGKISKQEYLVAMGLVPQENHMEAMMRSTFQSFDKDGSGSIDAAELKLVFEEMGKTFSKEELERMIQLADQDAAGSAGSGTLEYEEFIKHCFGK